MNTLSTHGAVVFDWCMPFLFYDEVVSKWSVYLWQELTKLLKSYNLIRNIYRFRDQVLVKKMFVNKINKYSYSSVFNNNDHYFDTW